MRFPRQRIVLSIAGVIIALVAGVFFLMYRDDSFTARLSDGRTMTIDQGLFSRVEWAQIKEIRPVTDKKSPLVRKLEHTVATLLDPYYPIPSPPLLADFFGSVNVLPLASGKQVYLSGTLTDITRGNWPAFTFGTNGTNRFTKVRERKLGEAILEAFRTNGVSSYDNQNRGVVKTNYLCIIITSRKEIRILTAAEFEAALKAH
jgi:hypothetical protein